MEKANTRGAADATGGSPDRPAPQGGPTTGPGFVTTQRAWRVMTDATLRYRAAYWIRGCRSRSYFLSTSSSRDEAAPSSTAVRWQVACWWKRLWRFQRSPQ